MAEAKAGWVTQQELENLVADNQREALAAAARALRDLAQHSAAEQPELAPGLVVAELFLWRLAEAVAP